MNLTPQDSLQRIQIHAGTNSLPHAAAAVMYQFSSWVQSELALIPVHGRVRGTLETKGSEGLVLNTHRML